ncbi:MAG TPA: DUF3330 domain-containing protein [Candidatus Aminicenantes bacterium]|nr:DUF3330 domain-containing protein [Candidatus Aminicenantes bacterium]
MADEEKISCHVCRKEIPRAAALHAEGRDYVLHFCNTECLDYWKREEAAEKPQKKGEKPVCS